MEKYVYAIPSYNRAKRQFTLDFLSRVGVPKERIFIFVQTEKDYAEYSAFSDRANIVLMPAKGGQQARNNVKDYLYGIDVLMMDDDVKKIYSLSEGALKVFTSRVEMARAFNHCFAMTRRLGAKMFGVYPVDNAFFMANDISTKTFVNTVVGFTGDFPYRYDESFETKEDAEICGRVMRDGGRVVRFNSIAITADHRKNKNGYIDKWHHDENVLCVKKLCARYPDIFTPQNKKPWEVRVRLKDERFPDVMT